MQIIHNPSCSKSNQALKLIRDNNIEPEIFFYLKERVTQKLLKEVLRKLKIKAHELVRKTEPIYKEKFAGRDFSNSEWIKILANNPRLIQRPIVIQGDKAVVARPTEKLLELL